MVNSLESYIRLSYGRGITAHTLTVQSCGAAVSFEIRPEPDTGLRIEFGVDGCRCWPISWDQDTVGWESA